MGLIMNNTEIFTRMEQSIINYDKEEAVRLAKMALEQGIEPAEAINNGFIKGIKAVGALFGEGDIFLPELVMGADAMSAVSDVLGESIKQSGGNVQYLARGIAGTVQGDIHDIGIKLVTTFMTTNGFDITFLGVDIPTSLFIEKVNELKPDFILLSALLSTTIHRQKEVIDSLKEAGIRENVKVMIGGAIVTQEWADQIGADGYGMDAVSAVAMAKNLMGIR